MARLSPVTHFQLLSPHELNKLLVCRESHRLAPTRKVYQGTQFRHSPAEVEQFTYHLALSLSEHPQLDFKHFWRDPIGAARACPTVLEQPELLRVVERFAQVTRGHVEFVPTVPSHLAASADQRRAWFHRAAPRSAHMHFPERIRRILGTDIAPTTRMRSVAHPPRETTQLPRRPLPPPEQTPLPTSAPAARLPKVLRPERQTPQGPRLPTVPELHELLPLTANRRIASDVHRESPTGVNITYQHTRESLQQFLYLTARHVVEIHGAALLSFIADPLSAAETLRLSERSPGLHAAVVRLSGITRLLREYSFRIPMSAQLLSAEERRQLLLQGTPLSPTTDPFLTTMLDPLPASALSPITVARVNPHLVRQARSAPSPFLTAPTPDHKTDLAAEHRQNASHASSPGAAVLDLLPHSPWTIRGERRSRRHPRPVVEAFAQALARHLETAYDIPRATLAHDPLSILRRTDLDLEHRDRGSFLAILRFALLSSEPREFAPLTPTSPLASPRQRLAWMRSPELATEQQPPTGPPRPRLTRDAIIDRLTAAAAKASVTLTLREGGSLQGQVIFEPARTNLRIINIEAQRSKTLTLDDVVDVSD